MTVVLKRRGSFDAETHREKRHVMKEAEIGVIHLQDRNPKDCGQWLGKKDGPHSPSEPTEETSPGHTLIPDFQHP